MAHANADWPVHRGNQQRTSYVAQPITATEWQPAWRHDSLSPPTAAWPAAAKGSLWQKLSHIEPRVTDDVADVPLIVLDSDNRRHVLVTSSANDRLISLNPATGEIQWQFVARAPIRYAPSVVDGIAYLGADDGIVRAIEVATGNEIWSVRLGPGMPWIAGNGRLISPHPIRTSVLVEDDQLVATTGLFPSQGVYLVALDRETGEVLWRRKTDKSPQGYLLEAGDNKVYVPTGRAVPFAITATDGATLFDLPSPGGSFCMLTPDAFFAGPGNSASVQARSNQSNGKMLSFDGRQVAAGDGAIWSATGKQLICVNTADVATGDLAPKWSVDCDLQDSLIVSGSPGSPVVFVAGGSKVRIFQGSDGNQLTTLTVPDSEAQIKYLAVSQSHQNQPELLTATTQSGTVYSWSGITQGATSDWPKPNRDMELPSLATDSSDARVQPVLERLPTTHGLALLLDDDSGELAGSLLERTSLTIVSLVNDAAVARELQIKFQQRGLYGHRVAVWDLPVDQPLPFSPGLFNTTIVGAASNRTQSELMAMLVDKIGVLSMAGESELIIKPELVGAGKWRHQYADPTNHADSGDLYVGAATGFRLQWFGGVGPSRMPDRHLRGPAPLAVGAVMVLQGDGVLIGVDPANGTERWQRKLPKYAMRYVTPFDAGYACLSEDGDTLFFAAATELWRINAYTGKIEDSIQLPRSIENFRWGYVAQIGDAIYTTGMKSTAPRTAQDNATRYTFVNNDYNSERPLVTSRAVVKLSLAGKHQWDYQGHGVVAHSSIAVDEEHQRMIFVESRSAECIGSESDQIPVPTLMQDAHLVCLDTESGDVRWEQPLNWSEARNMIYGQLVDDRVVLTSSESEGGKANYVMRVFSAVDGSQTWQAKHRHIRSGLFHGEQVHHPVILNQPNGSKLLVAEPYLYDIGTGDRVVPEGAAADWALNRPGHSCGTLSGAGHCLFFRASNPTVLNLAKPGGTAFTALAPTRAGCWINMIPATGRLLIPEGSASCVCNYSIQTSLAFVPVLETELDSKLPMLDDVLPE